MASHAKVTCQRCDITAEFTGEGALEELIAWDAAHTAAKHPVAAAARARKPNTAQEMIR